MKYGRLIIVVICGLIAFLLYILYLGSRLTTGGLVRSTTATATLPLIVQADVSLLAFWGFMIVFRFNQLSSTRMDLVRNIWDIDFKKRELGAKIQETKDEKKREFLMRCSEEFSEAATIRKKTVEDLYELETRTILVGLLAVAFFLVSICSGIYGISIAHATESLDQLTYFTPSIAFFTGVLTTIYAVIISSWKLDVELGTPQHQSGI
jgi:hypothetical protein